MNETLVNFVDDASKGSESSASDSDREEMMHSKD
jgi:hypothetical protein